jgi:ubiquitin-conjugating enzyme (huntingtin interacting protein 2)
MLTNHPEQFDRVAREWAVKHAGAPKSLLTAGGASYTHSAPPKPKTHKSKEQEMREQIARYENFSRGRKEIYSSFNRYQGYNKDLIDRFVNMGFEIDRVVEAFNFVGIDRNDGQDYELEEAYMGDITARLLGEP